MYPPCETLGRYILPIFRSLVAKELIEKYKLTQLEVAERLGTTQAAISQYVHSKRGYKSIPRVDKILPRIQTVANETAALLASKKMSRDDAILKFCKICILLQEEAKLSVGQ